DRPPCRAALGALIHDPFGATRLAVGDVRSGARRGADGDRVRRTRVNAQRPRVLALHIARQEPPGLPTIFRAEHTGNALLFGHLGEAAHAAKASGRIQRRRPQRVRDDDVDVWITAGQDRRPGVAVVFGGDHTADLDADHASPWIGGIHHDGVRTRTGRPTRDVR